jgi:NitT/TauT family transport system ATP-binding protein
MRIEISNLTFAYQDRSPVLSDISLQFEGEGFIVFTGPSGCGKTTLLRLLLAAPSIVSAGRGEGKVRVNGHEPSVAVAEGRVSYMSQDDSLFPNLTLLDNLRLPFLIKRKPVPPDFAELIDLAGLKNYLSHFPYQLSGGTKKRGELVRAFLTRPSLVLLDEPFSKQDIRHKNSLYEYLLRFQSMTRALVVLVTHDLMEAVLLSNRIFVFNVSGRVQRDMRITKPLPRILAPDGIKLVGEEFVELRSLILSEAVAQ